MGVESTPVRRMMLEEGGVLTPLTSQVVGVGGGGQRQGGEGGLGTHRQSRRSHQASKGHRHGEKRQRPTSSSRKENRRPSPTDSHPPWRDLDMDMAAASPTKPHDDGGPGLGDFTEVADRVLNRRDFYFQQRR